MLESLGYLAFRNLIHRDVKPDNILYTPTATGGYLFQLADFGFANRHNLVETQCGSPLFMAPEMYFSKGPQTAKMNVWSPFATLICLACTAGFTERIDSYGRALDLLRTAATIHPNCRLMAREDPTLRASAAQLLWNHFHGDGMTTPRNRVTPISDFNDFACLHQSQRAPEISSKATIPKMRRLGNKNLPNRHRDVRVPGAFPQFNQLEMAWF